MKHKMICISDTHGQVPADVHDEESMLCWLHAGDFYDRIRYCKSIPAPRFPHLAAWYKARKIPVHMVRGNHDCQDPESVQKAAGIEGALREIAPGLFVAGIGFAASNFYDLPDEPELRPQCSDILRQAAFKMKKGDRAILLTHYPAMIKGVYQVNGFPGGWLFDCVREVIDALAPVAVVNGHVHEFFGQAAAYQGTLLVHPGPDPAILTVDMDAGKANVVFRPRSAP